MSLQNHEVWANATTPLFLQNPTTSITLAGTPPLVLSNDNGTLTENGQPSPPTPQWSLFPALNNKIFMDASNVITNIGEFLYFDNNLLAYAQDIPNIGNWSFYPQNYNVNGANHTIYSNAGLDSTGVIATTGYVSTPAISTTGTLVTTANRFSNAGITGSDTLIDRGLDVFGDASYSVTAQNGRKGTISFTANGGNNNGSNGQVDITANGSTIGSFATGGLINISANTPVSSNYTFTSAIKMTASSMLSYAGSFSPLLSLAGYNYIWGQGGVNITSTPTPPSIAVPNTAGSVFISGFAGTKISNGLYVDTITNYSGQDLTIASPVFSGSNANISVVSGKQLNLTALTGTAGAVVINGNTTNVTGHAGGLNLFAVDGGNVNLYGNVGINSGNLEMGGNRILNVPNISNSAGNIYIQPASGNFVVLDAYTSITNALFMNNNNINDVNAETFRYGGSITTDINTGTSQGFMTIKYPSAGTGHTSDGALFLKGGTAGGTSGERYIGIDSTNIDIYIPVGSGNLYLSANTIMNGGFLSASNIINAQTISSPALSNLTIQANSSSLILKAPGNSIIAESDVRLNAGNLFMNNNRIYDVTSIYASTSSGSNFDLGGGGAGHYFTLFNGSAYLQFSSSLDAYMGASNINLTASTGGIYLRGNTIMAQSGTYFSMAGNTMYGLKDMYADSNLNLYAGAGYSVNLSGVNVNVSANLNMSNNNISNVSNITFSNGNSITTASNSININGGGSSSYLNLTNAGTTISFAGPNLYIGGAGGINLTSTTSMGATFNANGQDITAVAQLTRKLGSTSINQPVLQYGVVTGSGASGSNVVTLPTAYTSSTSYVAFVTMDDVDPARMSANRDSATQITIYWSQAGAGTHTISWNTMGS